MRDKLEAFLRTALPFQGRLEIVGIEELKAGWETEIYFVSVCYGPEGARTHWQLVLRVYQGEVGAERARREYRALQALQRGGYPVPHVYALALHDSPLGRPLLVMERVPGGPLAGPLLRGTDAAQQDALLTLFCQLMVDLRRLDWRLLADDALQRATDDPRLLVNRELERLAAWRSRLDLLGFGPALDWLLARHADVPCGRPSIVHGDLHPNNVILRPDGTPVVLDWTQADVSDPRVDLGWTLLLLYSEVSSEWRERVLARYEELLAEPVEGLGYFEALACVKRLALYCLVMGGGAKELGLRGDLTGVLATQRARMGRVYLRLQEFTGVRLTSVEPLLEVA